MQSSVAWAIALNQKVARLFDNKTKNLQHYFNPREKVLPGNKIVENFKVIRKLNHSLICYMHLSLLGLSLKDDSLDRIVIAEGFEHEE